MKKDKNVLIMGIVLCIIILVVLASFIFILRKEKSTDIVETNTVEEPIIENVIEEPDEEIDDEEPENIENNEFSTSFLRLENNKKNMIYSPLSIKYALKMLDEGAEGDTKKQIEDFIGNEDLTKYKDIEKILSLANAVYVREEFSSQIKENYIDILKEKYNAEVKYDSFANAKNINAWIEEKTFEKIKDMLADEQVSNPDNRLILVNALAIDMKWKNEFERKNTYGEPFYKIDGSKIEATTMSMNSKSDNASYYKDNDITVLAMDLEKYDDSEFEFIAIMPDNDLSNYVEEFTEDKLEKITDNLTLASIPKKGVNISIPKFEFDYTLSLKNDLIDMGITDAFDSKEADFSNMANIEGYYVGDAIHKANIEFSEEGIKASASTVIFMAMNAMLDTDSEKPIDIIIDKPFLYVIRDKNTKEIWFLGTVYEPNLWEKDKADYSR